MTRALAALGLALVGLASCHGSAEWSRYRSEAAGFSVEFPGKPTESVQHTVAAVTVTEEDRCVVAGGHMFHLTAIGPDQPAIRRDGTRFLDSFALAPN